MDEIGKKQVDEKKDKKKKCKEKKTKNRGVLVGFNLIFFLNYNYIRSQQIRKKKLIRFERRKKIK